MNAQPRDEAALRTEATGLWEQIKDLQVHIRGLDDRMQQEDMRLHRLSGNVASAEGRALLEEQHHLAEHVTAALQHQQDLLRAFEDVQRRRVDCRAHTDNRDGETKSS